MRCLPTINSAFPRRSGIVSLVELLPVQEHHDVGVLFDRSGFPQIRQLGPPVAATLFRCARQLRQRHEGNVELLGQLLERAGDVRDLLLSIFVAPPAAHQLQVVHDEQVEAVLAFQDAGPSPASP